MQYYVILDDEQDLEDEEIDKILKELSKTWRVRLYKNGDFRKHVDEDGYYCFLTGDYSIDGCVDELKDYGIDAYLKNEKEFNQLIEELVEQEIEESPDFKLVLLDDQKLDDNEVDKILKNISKKSRDSLHMNGDFRDSINKYGAYGFLISKDIDFLNEIDQELHSNGIKSSIYNEEEFEELEKKNCNTYFLSICGIENKTKSDFNNLLNFLGELDFNVDYNFIKNIIKNINIFVLQITLSKKTSNSYISELKSILDSSNINYKLEDQKSFDNGFEKYFILDFNEVDNELEEQGIDENKIEKILNEMVLVLSEIDYDKEIVQLSSFWFGNYDEEQIVIPFNENNNKLNYSVYKKFLLIAKKYNLPYRVDESIKVNNTGITNETITIFKDLFNKNIIGQEKVEEKISKQLINSVFRLDNWSRPASILFFAGPTGVGKTETCKVLSEAIFNNKNINRFDMSEYKNETSIGKLIGADNGYVGYEEGGTLINAMKKNPNSIVLFDEIEKCHNSVFDIFLQILDEGFVTSNKGEKISFKNNIIIFTSNIGASSISPNNTDAKNEQIIKNEIDEYFTSHLNRPEILGRIGMNNIVVFNTINKKEDIFKIIDIQFYKLINPLYDNYGISLEFDRNKIYTEIMKSIDVTKGARDIRNAFDEFQSNFMTALYENGYNYEELRNTIIQIEYFNNKVKILNIERY